MRIHRILSCLFIASSTAVAEVTVDNYHPIPESDAAEKGTLFSEGEKEFLRTLRLSQVSEFIARAVYASKEEEISSLELGVYSVAALKLKYAIDESLIQSARARTARREKRIEDLERESKKPAGANVTTFLQRERNAALTDAIEIRNLAESQVRTLKLIDGALDEYRLSEKIAEIQIQLLKQPSQGSGDLPQELQDRALLRRAGIILSRSGYTMLSVEKLSLFNEDKRTLTKGAFGIYMSDFLDEPSERSEKPRRKVVVTSVVEGRASHGVLEAGDVILSINGKSISDAEGVHSFGALTKGGESVSLLIRRDGQQSTVRITLQALNRNHSGLSDFVLAKDSAVVSFPLGFQDVARENGGTQNAAIEVVFLDLPYALNFQLHERFTRAFHLTSEFSLKPLVEGDFTGGNLLAAAQSFKAGDGVLLVAADGKPRWVELTSTRNGHLSLLSTTLTKLRTLLFE